MAQKTKTTSEEDRRPAIEIRIKVRKIPVSLKSFKVSNPNEQ